VRRELGEVDRQVRSVGEAARDLRGLQELLRSPKMRGGVGEHLLNELLAHEFAMMYIPAEAVYQEALRQEGDGTFDLFQYALSKKVVPVSPQSFYAYLQVIVLGLRGLSIEERAREILGRVGQLQRSLAEFNETFDLAVKHLGNAGRQMGEAGRRLARIDAAVGELAGATSEPRPGVREIAG
jgi:DNA anti-recombination protein RmuC